MDVDVVGAGPAGLMAAEVLAMSGHTVRVFDQRRSPARKFVLAGRGGLNITHGEPIEALLDRYGPDRPHLEPAIRAFTPEDLRTWCSELGHPTFVGSSGRVFPDELRAVPLLRSWLRRLATLGVELRTEHRWTGWTDSGGLRFVTPDATVEAEAAAVILALGGASWPQVGGDGSWTELLSERGVDVRPLAPANCGVLVEWSEHHVDRFAGTPIKNAAVIVNGHISRGEPIVTRRGLEGGPIYAHSRRIRQALTDGPVRITVGLVPDLDHERLEHRLRSVRRPRDSASTWLRRAGIAPVAQSLLREATATSLPTDPAVIAALAKAVPLSITGTTGLDRAISTAGGVAWSEVDEMLRLRALPSVSVVGEMLDWDAPTGGYLLQACLSTARWAANALG